MKGSLSTGHKPLAFFRNLAHCHSLCRIRHEAVFFNCDVELYQIAFLHRALARNPMHRLFIQADAVHSGKFVNQLRRRLRSMLPHHRRADFIQLRRSHAWSHSTLHRFDHPPHY